MSDRDQVLGDVVFVSSVHYQQMQLQGLRTEEWEDVVLISEIFPLNRSTL